MPPNAANVSYGTLGSPNIGRPWRWISLMFSVFYFFSFFFIELTLPFIAQSLILYGLFVFCYLKLLDCSAKKAPWLIAVMCLLAVIGTPINSSSNVFFGYAALFSGFYFQRNTAILVTLAITGCLLASATVFNLWAPHYIFPGLVPTISLGFMGIVIQQAERHRIREQRSDEEKKQLATVAERERIARDLHDTLGHTLSSIALKAQLAKKLGSRGDIDAAIGEINEVAAIASEALTDVRRVVSGYKNKGLTEQLTLLQSRLESAGFQLTLNKTLEYIEPRTEAAIILMLIEATTNIIRHSKGNAVSFDLLTNAQGLVLSVKDNGHVNAFTEGNGIKGIHERLDDLNGQLTIHTNQGFHLQMNIPA